jgi:hypothetical protein
LFPRAASAALRGCELRRLKGAGMGRIAWIRGSNRILPPLCGA